MSLFPECIWLLDDNKDAVKDVKNKLGEKKGVITNIEKSSSAIKALLKKKDSPPDLILLDICLESNEEETIIKVKNNFEDMIDLTKVSGIEFLTWLSHEWPKLPVVLISAFWSRGQANPNLLQHAVCLLSKPLPDSFPNLLGIAQQAIVGIHLPKKFQFKAQEVLNEINNQQHHFYFVFYENKEGLMTPPSELDIGNKSEKMILFETWNNRVMGIIEDKTLVENPSDILYTMLLSNHRSLRRFVTNLSKEIEYMGDEYFAPFLLRECARAAYHLFFNIKSHPINTGKCIFDSSTYPPDLLPGISRSEGICPECRYQMNPSHAHGGWSQGRDASANKILQLAREKLATIQNIQ